MSTLIVNVNLEVILPCLSCGRCSFPSTSCYAAHNKVVYIVFLVWDLNVPQSPFCHANRALLGLDLMAIVPPSEVGA